MGPTPANFMANDRYQPCVSGEPNCNGFPANFGTGQAPRTGPGKSMGWMVDHVGRFIAHYLEKPEHGYEPYTSSGSEALRATLMPGDVLLVEGSNHISGVIKYLTQSTWSHAALYVGPIGDRETADGEPLVLVEANIGQGVVTSPLSKYSRFHTRICRPTGLTEEDRSRACPYAAERIGFDYDLKNIFDLIPCRSAGAGAESRSAPATSDAHHLLGFDRPSLRAGALSDPAQGDANGWRAVRSWKSATPRSTRRATSTSRPISRWFKPTLKHIPAHDADELVSLVPTDDLLEQEIA